MSPGNVGSGPLSAVRNVIVRGKLQTPSSCLHELANIPLTDPRDDFCELRIECLASMVLSIRPTAQRCRESTFQYGCRIMFDALVRFHEVHYSIFFRYVYSFFCAAPRGTQKQLEVDSIDGQDKYCGGPATPSGRRRSIFLARLDHVRQRPSLRGSLALARPTTPPTALRCLLFACSGLKSLFFGDHRSIKSFLSIDRISYQLFLGAGDQSGWF